MSPRRLSGPAGDSAGGSRRVALALGWTLVYLGLALIGPGGLKSTMVWPTVSQHLVQARAWLGEDIHVPTTDGEDQVIPVAPRLDVTPYFRHRVMKDARENGLISNLAVGMRAEDGTLAPVQELVNRHGVDPMEAVRGAECHVGFPPGPAFVLTPLRFVLGEALATQWLAALFGGLAVAAMAVLRRSWVRRHGESQLPGGAFSLLAGAGTLWLWMVPDGGTFLFAQTVGASASAVALALAATGRPGLAGAAFAVAVTSRPAILGTLPFAAFLIWHARATVAERLAGVVRFSVAPALLGVLALVLNWLRFGSPWEFGYRFMLIPPFLAERIAEHGALSLSHLLRNAWIVLLSPPAVVTNGTQDWVFPWLVSAREGMGLVFVAPAVVAGVLAAILVLHREPLRLAVLGGALALTVLPGLLYYNSGWVQWGGRFLMDAWPLWLLLAWEGLRRLPVRAAWVLIWISVLSNAWAAGLTAFGLWPACAP